MARGEEFMYPIKKITLCAVRAIGVIAFVAVGTFASANRNTRANDNSSTVR
jgi:hypothetical protein